MYSKKEVVELLKDLWDSHSNWSDVVKELKEKGLIEEKKEEVPTILEFKTSTKTNYDSVIINGETYIKK